MAEDDKAGDEDLLGEILKAEDNWKLDTSINATILRG